MAKTQTRFEQIPIALVEKILKKQTHLARRNDHRTLVVRKSRGITDRLHESCQKSEVPAL